MILIDSKTYKFDTEETTQQIVENLKLNTVKNRFELLKRDTDKHFIGNIRTDKFKIRPVVINGYSSFVPRIKGTMKKKSNSTAMVVKFTINPIAEIFLIIWLFILMLICFFLFSEGLSEMSFSIGIGGIIALFFMTRSMLKTYREESKLALSKLIEIIKPRESTKLK